MELGKLGTKRKWKFGIGSAAAIALVASLLAPTANAQPSSVVVIGDSIAAGASSTLRPIEVQLHPELKIVGNIAEDPNLIKEGTWDRCHQSWVSWPDLLGYKNVACGSATIQEVIDGKFGQQSQLDALDDTTTKVVIVASANDIDFGSGFMCIVTSDCTREAIPEMFVKLGNVQGDLERLISAAHSKAPQATIHIAGYPDLFPATGPLGPLCPGITEIERDLAVDIQGQLAQAGKKAVTATANRGINVEFITIPTPAGADACSIAPNRAITSPITTTNPPREALHLNWVGHHNWAEVMPGALASIN